MKSIEKVLKWSSESEPTSTETEKNRQNNENKMSRNILELQLRYSIWFEYWVYRQLTKDQNQSPHRRGNLNYYQQFFLIRNQSQRI